MEFKNQVMKSFPGMQQLMRQAQQMQNRLAKVKEDLKKREFEGQAGGDLIQVKINGSFQCLSIHIDKEAVDTEDLEMLQDLILTAFNQAVEIARKTSDEETNKVSGGLPSLPGLF